MIFKKNLIAGLYSVNPNFPSHIWDRLLDQATTTLNIMRKSMSNTNIPVHDQIFGIFNFNCTPFISPGKIILIHENPKKKTIYILHGSDN